MYSSTTSRGRTSVSPVPAGGGRRSTRVARGTKSSRRARSVNSSSPYSSSQSSGQPRDELFHGQLKRRSEPARRWVEVMRPPAPHIKFKVAMWVPLKDLTDSEREEYEKRKQQDQEEKAMHDTVSTDLPSSQPAESTVVDNCEERYDPSSVAAQTGQLTTAPDTPVAIPAQQDTPAPMAISLQPENVSNKRKLGEEDYSTLSFSSTSGNPSDEAKRRKLNEATVTEEEK